MVSFVGRIVDSGGRRTVTVPAVLDELFNTGDKVQINIEKVTIEKEEEE